MAYKQVQIAVVGGGIVGVSILNALARLGVSDLVLIERTLLTAGSTWHFERKSPELKNRRQSVAIKIHEG